MSERHTSVLHKIILVLYSALLFIIACMTSSCAEDFVDPFNNEERFFTVYGYLDALQVSHEIRVIPVSRLPAVIQRPSDRQAELDAEVTTTDLTSGEVVEWDYALEELGDGTYAHIFRSVFAVTPGRAYRLDVTRVDGIKAWAITEVPHIPDSAFYNLGQVSYSQDSSEVKQEIAIPGNLNPWKFEAIYNWNGDLFNRRVFVPYGRRGSSRGDVEWVMELTLSDDQSAVQESIRESLRDGTIMDDTPLILTGAGLRMTMLDKDWRLPDARLESEALEFPATTTNINNGYGFFGSIGYYVQEWEACELSGPLGYENAEPNCGARDPGN